MPTLLAALAVAAQASAPAPTAPAPAKASAADATVEAVVVTGAAAEVQTSIDRRSYSLGKDIQAASGSIADALRSLPAVAVDVQGGLTLRGDANVVILIDGKPAPAFEGAARADALQQLSADQFERVEVITNPSAAMAPDGSGGVINLISKASRGGGWTGSAYGAAGTAGLKRLGGTFGYNSKALSVTGTLSSNYQRSKLVFDLARATLDPASGLFEGSGIVGPGRNLNRTPSGRLTVSYALTPKDQLTANLSYSRMLIDGYPFNRFETRDIAGALTGYTERQGERRLSSADSGVSAGWRRNLAGEGRLVSVDLIQNRTRYGDDLLFTTLRSSPPTVTPFEFNILAFTTRHSEFKATYARPLPRGAKLSLGYEFKQDDNHYGEAVLRGAAASGLTPDARLGYDFDYRQSLSAAYATYERSFGDLGVQAGARIEDARLNLEERTTQARSAPAYFRAYPSAHLTYALDGGGKLRASYSTRVLRPSPFLLNPFRVYVDPLNYQQGNPNLRPQNTQSFEVSYDGRRGPATYQATIYYRQNEDEFSPVFRDLGAGVVILTFDNLGSSRSAGLELTASGKLIDDLTYNANVNLFRSEISATNVGGGGNRDAYGASGRMNLNWQASTSDLLQINASVQGPRLLAQGEQRPSWTLNLGWRRKIDDRVTATLSVQDALQTNRFRRETVTPTLRETLNVTFVSRAILLRLDYRFGGASAAKPAAEPGFDYGASTGP